MILSHFLIGGDFDVVCERPESKTELSAVSIIYVLLTIRSRSRIRFVSVYVFDWTHGGRVHGDGQMNLSWEGEADFVIIKNIVWQYKIHYINSF